MQTSKESKQETHGEREYSPTTHVHIRHIILHVEKSSSFFRLHTYSQLVEQNKIKYKEPKKKKIICLKHKLYTYNIYADYRSKNETSFNFIYKRDSVHIKNMIYSFSNPKKKRKNSKYV